ncbi:MAG: hypothetical protein AAGU11_17835 [Syntrophobacteraceae bacterium]
MKKTAIALAFIFTLSLTVTAFAQVWVDPYVKKDGTYVQGHMRSSPNNTSLDNYSTKGNVNPYTGESGTKDPYSNNYNKQYKPKRNW